MQRHLGPFPPSEQEYSMKQAERDVLEAHVETQKQRIAELQEELAQARAQEQILNARIEQLEKQAQGAAWCGLSLSLDEFCEKYIEPTRKFITDAAWQAYLDASQEMAPKLPPSIDEAQKAFEGWAIENFRIQKAGLSLLEYSLMKTAYIAAALRFGGVK